VREPRDRVGLAAACRVLNDLASARPIFRAHPRAAGAQRRAGGSAARSARPSSSRSSRPWSRPLVSRDPAPRRILPCATRVSVSES
jgi:hypothetical protein